MNEVVAWQHGGVEAVLAVVAAVADVVALAMNMLCDGDNNDGAG